MKAVVFYTEESSASLDAVCGELNAVSCPYSLKKMVPGTVKTVQEQFLPFPEDTTHLVFVISAEKPDTGPFSVFVFFAGYCMGRNLRAVVIGPDTRKSTPPMFRAVATFIDAEGFSSFIRTESKRIAVEETSSMARSRLLAMGISFFAENFFKCVEAGQEEESALFLQAGFDANLKDIRGNPLLTVAVRGGNLQIVRLLLDAGADINAESGDRGYSPVMDAVHTKKTEIAAFLLERGADPNRKGRDSQTALCIAAGRGDVEACRLLVQYHADPTVPDGLGMSAAGYAKLFHNPDLCALFGV